MLKIEMSQNGCKCAAKGTTDEIMLELTASVYMIAKNCAKPMNDEKTDEFCSRMSISLLEAVHAVRENHKQ